MCALRGAAYGAAAGIGLALGMSFDWPSTARAAGAAAASLAGGICGALTAPRRARAARMIDARLRLEDRLITSLEAAGQPHPMARALLDDTWNRLAPVPPASIVRVPRLAGAAALAVALAAASLLARPGAFDRPASVTQAQDAAAHAAAGAAADRATGSGDAAAGAAGSVSAPDGLRRSEAAAVASEGAARRAEGLIPAPGGTGYLAPEGGAAASGGANGTGAGIEGRADTSSAGGISTAGGSSDTGGMGVTAGESREVLTPAHRQTPPVDPMHPVVRRTEAALSRVQVPPGLRRYVMDYFLTIAR